MAAAQLFSYTIDYVDENGGFASFFTCNKEMYDKKESEIRNKGLEVRQTRVDAARRKAG